MVRIAIAEDDPAYRATLEEYLDRYRRENGLEAEVTTFSDGLALTEGYRPVYDLLLLDIEMPNLDGMSAAEKIRSSDPEVVIIFITNMAQYAIKGYQVDALDYVLKPVSYAAFAFKLKKAQYDIAKENIALINRKCHDLKHQIAALARPGTDRERNNYLKEVEDAIQIYDCTVKTGSEVLDTVLTEKKLYCEAHRINMTCVADGSKLGFMDPVDVYAMLGNAIDNAIEAVSGLPDPEQRLIAVSVWTGRGLLLLQFENYFDHALSFEDGLPATTKARDGYHGFGLSSIRSTAEKYGGCMTLHTEDGLFVLRVSIPLP